MKAAIIISQEFELNMPRVFVNINGQYFGDLTYPILRNNPSVDYWSSATSSDYGRGFKVIESNVTSEIFEEIAKLQLVIDANSAMIRSTSWHWPVKNYNVKRGKAWEAYKAKKEHLDKAIAEEQAYNYPFEKAKYVAYNMQRNLLVKLTK